MKNYLLIFVVLTLSFACSSNDTQENTSQPEVILVDSIDDNQVSDSIIYRYEEDNINSEEDGSFEETEVVL